MRLAILVLFWMAWLGNFTQSLASGVQTNSESAIAQATPNSTFSCPADIKTLTAQLLQDLPGYANRVIKRADILPDAVEMDVYVIVAGQAEFEPLSLGPGQYEDTTTDPKPPEQVFFTTLERQYLDEKVVTTQNYHWLFLSETDSGWRMALLYTRLGSPSKAVPPRPPLETSDGIIGQAVRIWLRDCRAGALRIRS